MPPIVAAFAFAVGILGLLLLDRNKEAPTSPALWVPVIWLSIAGSRMVSLWVGQGSLVSSVADAAEGNALDRNILTGMIAIGVVVLFRRRATLGRVLWANLPMILFFGYAAVSILWSDFPDVAIKRWIKAVGDVVMGLVVLTDPAGSEAIKRLLARVGSLLVPISVLLIKYYPALGQSYGGPAKNEVLYTGVTTDKNLLGALCLLTAMGCVWRLILFVRRERHDKKLGPIIGQLALLLLTLWLFHIANSMTSLGCFILASGVMSTTLFSKLRENRAVPHLLVVSMLTLVMVGLFVQAGAGLVEAMGRDQGLTDRTELWGTLIRVNENPIFGAGFESYWLGERLENLWSIYWWHPNESHNGYLEVFINLGAVGLVMFGVLVAGGYRTAVRAYRENPEIGGLKLAWLATGLAYAFTEAGFRLLHPVWIVFVLMLMAPSTAIQASEGEPAVAAPPRMPASRWSRSRPDVGFSSARSREARHTFQPTGSRPTRRW
ncbi:MAG TPA: O-antigen ligase family protein [Vicinamibacterales bacterium]|jgi:hypothetical protein